MTGTSSKMAQNRSSRRTSIREALLEEKQAQSARVTSPAVARPEEARPVGLDQDVSTAVRMSVCILLCSVPLGALATQYGPQAYLSKRLKFV
jgi:hypothetical protein